MLSLEEYDIDPHTGFLPSQPPLRRLTDPYFEPWESMMSSFNALLLAGQLRAQVHKIPLLDHTRLRNVQEYRRAFLVLCMISHSYVWGKQEKASETLPPNIAIPWCAVAEHLELCPVVCHAAVILWNYRLINPDGDIDLSNIAALATYSGSLDEAWFYLITTAIESEGAVCLPAMITAIDHVDAGDNKALLADLHVIHQGLRGVNQVFGRMQEHCDPYVFYWRIRPYLAGWENMAEAGLPLGLIYEGVPAPDEDAALPNEEENAFGKHRRYAGGSAAQSSLIAAFDVAFGVDHHPTGEHPSSAMFDFSVKPDLLHQSSKALQTDDLPPDLSSSCSTGTLPSPSSCNMHVRTNRNEFLRSMRKYMPGPHRRFLEDLEESANLRSYAFQLYDRWGTGELSDTEMDVLRAYNDCVHELKVFRDLHIKIVSRYIVSQGRRGNALEHHDHAVEDSLKLGGQGCGRFMLASQKNHHHEPVAVCTKPNPSFSGHGLAKRNDPASETVRGTGGTNIMPFLKQSRDETERTKLVVPATQEIMVQELSMKRSLENEQTKTGMAKRMSWLQWLVR